MYLDNPKEYLRQLRRLEMCIHQLEEELEKLRELIGSLPVSYDERIQHSSSADGIPNEVARRIELEEDIKRKIGQFLRLRHKIINEIQSLDSYVYSSILYKRYVEYKTLEEIAVEMNYSYIHIRRMHGYALQEFRKKIK